MAELYLEEQRIFDELQFDQDAWQAPEWRDQKTRHIQLHVAKAGLKLIASHDNDSIVAADAGLYRSQLILTHNLDPDTATAPVTITTGSKKVDNEHVPVTEMPTARQSLTYASGYLAQYLEPLEHGIRDDELRNENVTLATRHLHNASLNLSRMFNHDPSQLHLERMQKLLGDRASRLADVRLKRGA